MKITFKGKELIFCKGNYVVGSHEVALKLFVLPDWEPYCTLTVNIPGTFLEKDEVLIKTWSENEPIANFLRNGDIFEDTGKRVRTGYVRAEIWRFKDPNLLSTLTIAFSH